MDSNKPVGTGPLTKSSVTPSPDPGKGKSEGHTVTPVEATRKTPSPSSDDMPRKSIMERDVAASTESPSVKQQAVASKPGFSYQPIKAGGLLLGTFSKEVADSFMETIQSASKTSKLQNALKTAYGQFREDEVVANKLRGEFGKNWYVEMPELYDTDFYGENTAMPLRHSQVVLKEGSGREVRLCANKITYDDKFSGIALPGKPAADISKMLDLAWQENTTVFVSLLKPGGHSIRDQATDTSKTWDSPKQGQPEKFGDYTVELQEKIHPDSLRDATISRFKVTNARGESREISRIQFSGWADQSDIPVEQLESLHQLIDQEEALRPESRGIAVNCLAGVGRTGTLFATRHLRSKAKQGTLDFSQLNSEVFNVLVQGKMCRNTHFVQTPPQVRLIKAAAESFRKNE